MREGGEEWWETVGVWNQVFRVRFGGRRGEKALEDSHTCEHTHTLTISNSISWKS